MINRFIVNGNLCDNVKVSQTSNGGTAAFGKIGVYNGKDKSGQNRPSMFFDIAVFGRDAEMLRDNATKGTPIIVSGRLEEDTTVSQSNGQTYVNKKIICDGVNLITKPASAQVQQQVVQVQPQVVDPNEYPW